MFHLTPQEKSVLSGFLTVCFLGTAIHYAVHWNLKPVQWVNVTAHEFKLHPPPDINKADAQEMDRVPGIGPKTAQNIIDYRTAHGPFASIEDLRKVKGITKRNFPKIQAYLQPKEKHG